MADQAIYLDSEDDIVSICDRLDWARGERVVLVLPEEGDLLTEYLDLVRLRRYAENLDLKVGLVTLDGRVVSQARMAGLPTFSTLEASEQKQGRWQSGWRKTAGPPPPTPLSSADRQEVIRRNKPRPTWQHWSLRYAGILIFFITVAILFITLVFAIPGATITLRPEMRPVQVSKQLVADPQLEATGSSGSSVQGRVLSTVQEWQAEVATSGFVEVPDAPARGKVIFVNQLGQPTVIPAGTRVSTSTGSREVFQTTEVMDVPEGAGSTAEVEVVAVEPGPDGNVEVGLINLIEGSLALQLQVRNLEPLTGGVNRTEPAVTEADQERLRSQVSDQLRILALAEMESMLSGREFLAENSMQVTQILHETYSHFPGEASNNLALEMRAEFSATAVDETQAVGLVYDEVAASVAPGFELLPDSLRLKSGDVLGVDGDGRVTFEMIGEAMTAAHLGLDGPIEEIAGQEINLAVAYLNERLPLRELPSVHVWPDWFGRLPYLPVRIRAFVETDGY